MIELVLPYPISVNDFMHDFVPKGWTRPVKFLTPEAKKYKKDCAWIAKAQGIRAPTAKPVNLTVILHPKKFDKNGKRSGTALDLSNCLKVAEDALKGVVYVDDRQVKHISMEYGERVDHGALVIKIEEREVEQTELFPAPLCVARSHQARMADGITGDPF